MTRIIVDDELQAKLRAPHDEVELRDAAGRVFGRFVPVVDLSEWEPVGPGISEEELDKRARSQKWHSTEKVLAHIRKLEQ